MVTSVVGIWNLALSACGASSTITSTDEQSREAALCRLWYEVTRDMVLAAAPWPSVRAHSRLASLSLADGEWEQGDPHPGFQRAYAAPSDLIVPYHLVSYRPFAFGFVGSSLAVSCNEEHPILFYNRRVEDPSMWDFGLRMAMVRSLAVMISVPLTGRSKRLEENAALAAQYVEDAQVAAANAQDHKIDSLSEWHAAGGYSEQTDRYYFPFQGLNLNA